MKPLLALALLLAGCHKPAPNDCMPVLTVDTSKGSVKCEAGQQYVEQFEFDISGASSVHVASKERPIAKFHYEGGAWCNVWADDKGIHWEACK